MSCQSLSGAWPSLNPLGHFRPVQTLLFLPVVTEPGACYKAVLGLIFVVINRRPSFLTTGF